MELIIYFFISFSSSFFLFTSFHPLYSFVCLLFAWVQNLSKNQKLNNKKINSCSIFKNPNYCKNQ